MAPVRGNDSVLLSWNLPLPADSQLYEFSVWSRLPRLGYTGNYFRLYFEDKAGHSLLWLEVHAKNSVDNMPGMWFRINSWFTMPPGTSKIAVQVCNPEGKSYEALDELMIRPAAATVMSRMQDGTLLVNNHLLKRKP